MQWILLNKRDGFFMPRKIFPYIFCQKDCQVKKEKREKEREREKERQQKERERERERAYRLMRNKTNQKTCAISTDMVDLRKSGNNQQREKQDGDSSHGRHAWGQSNDIVQPVLQEPRQGHQTKVNLHGFQPFLFFFFFLSPAKDLKTNFTRLSWRISHRWHHQFA